tara:strand:+ start:3285 stop:3545 length:261 start_codon:yes stop_codon:yes gene_type:complete
MVDKAVVSTKKLKSMLKMLRESGVSRYKDGEMEIEFGKNVPIQAQSPSKDFNISDYEPEENTSIKENADDLGLTEDDYLHWSANSQ